MLYLNHGQRLSQNCLRKGIAKGLLLRYVTWIFSCALSMCPQGPVDIPAGQVTYSLFFFFVKTKKWKFFASHCKLNHLFLEIQNRSAWYQTPMLGKAGANNAIGDCLWNGAWEPVNHTAGICLLSLFSQNSAHLKQQPALCPLWGWGGAGEGKPSGRLSSHSQPETLQNLYVR